MHAHVRMGGLLIIIPPILASAHHYIQMHLSQLSSAEPIIAIDATVGNGHDTLFLAKQLVDRGIVYGFDIQSQALTQTKKRLEEAGLLTPVRLFLQSHDRFSEVLSADHRGKIEAVMFNLGYLPHGDPSIITRSETTLLAIQQLSEWLAPGGMMTLVLYTGHPGGQEEADQVINWASSLPTKFYSVMWQQMLNRHHAPSLVVIEKKQSKK